MDCLIYGGSSGALGFLLLPMLFFLNNNRLKVNCLSMIWTNRLYPWVRVVVYDAGSTEGMKGKWKLDSPSPICVLGLFLGSYLLGTGE